MRCTASADLSADGPIDFRALAEQSLKTALAIPKDETCDGLFDRQDAAFLRAARRLLIGWSTAHEWTESELLGKAEASALAVAALGFGSDAGAARRGNVGASASCIDDGVSGFRECAAKCGGGGGLDRIGCLLQCRQAAIDSIVGCILRKVIAVFA